ncbi:hypothetical protein [uncultured Gammaproteobacteria bacterium]|nr:hypothetical protein [uncultured Gammaproteobacteria bacterium]
MGNNGKVFDLIVQRSSIRPCKPDCVNPHIKCPNWNNVVEPDNYLLIRDGFVPINIKFIDRADYYTAFNEFNESGKTKIMESIIGKALTNSCHKRLAYLEGKKIVSLIDYTKKYKISHSNLINKDKRQTIKTFSEKSKWKIGD